MNYFKYIFSYKKVMKEISDLDKELDITIKERELLRKDNKEIGNKIVVALEENKDLKKQIKKLNKQLKEVK